MNILHELRACTDSPWTGIQWLDSPAPGTVRSMRFCEAITRSFNQTLILPSHEFSCPGARRSFGLENDDDALARQIYQTTGISELKARVILSGRPKLNKPIAAVLMGDIQAPDIFVGYLQTAMAMKLLRIWQMRFGENLTICLSTFLAICSCVAGAILDRRLSFSLGCPISREEGGIPQEVLVAIAPVECAQAICER